MKVKPFQEQEKLIRDDHKNSSGCEKQRDLIVDFTIRNMPENKMKIALMVLLPLLLGSCFQRGKMDNEALKLLRKSEKKFNETYAGKEIDLLHMDFIVP
jgi:hypothetical protein